MIKIISDDVQETAIKFKHWDVKKVKVLDTPVNPSWKRWSQIPTEASSYDFIIANGTDGYDFLDNYRTWAFNADWNDVEDIVAKFNVNTVGIINAVIPADTVIDFTNNLPEDVPNVFYNSIVEVECEPKWEQNANVLTITTPAKEDQISLSISFNTELNTSFCVWRDSEAELMEAATALGDLDETYLKVATQHGMQIDYDNGAQIWYIKGDLSKIRSIKFEGDYEFHIEGLEHCTNLEVLEVLHSQVDLTVSQLTDRVIDVIPASVKYLYLDWVTVNDCLAKQAVIYSILGYSPCFTDIMNYVGDDTKIMRYYSMYINDGGNWLYKNTTFKIQKWSAKDLRHLDVGRVHTAEDITAFYYSAYMYLEPNPLIVNDEPVNRYINAGDDVESPATYVKSDFSWIAEFIEANRANYIMGEY